MMTECPRHQMTLMEDLRVIPNPFGGETEHERQVDKALVEIEEEGLARGDSQSDIVSRMVSKRDELDKEITVHDLGQNISKWPCG